MAIALGVSNIISLVRVNGVTLEGGKILNELK